MSQSKVIVRVRLFIASLFVIGSFLAPIGASAQSDDVQISVTNLTCTGFDWSVTAPFNVTVYVSSHDVMGAGIFPFEPAVDVMNPSGSKSYVIQTENQMNVNILISVYDPDDNEAELATKSTLLQCPIAEEPTETQTVTPTVTPTETPTETPDIGAGAQVQLTFTMPGGASIEGAPYSLFAPAASQFASTPYFQGVVGAGNTIVVLDLIPGSYRLLIEPATSPAIDFVFTVGDAQFTNLAYVVDAEGNATLQTQPAPSAPKPAPATGSSSNTGGPVKSLPATGAGESSSAIPLLIFAMATALTGFASLAVVRKTASR